MTDQNQVELAIDKDNVTQLGVTAVGGDSVEAPTVNVIDRNFGAVAPEPFPDIFGNQEWTMSSCSPTWSVLKKKDLYMKSKPDQRIFFQKEPGHDFDNYSMYYMPDKKAKGKDAEPIRLLEIIFSPDRKRARIYDARFKATNKTIYQIGEIHDETQCIGLCRPRTADVFGPNGDLRFHFKDTTNCCKCYTTCITYGCCLMRSGTINSDVFKSQGEVSGSNICICCGNYSIKVPEGQYSPEELALLSFAFEYWLIRDIDQINDIIGLLKKVNGQCGE